MTASALTRPGERDRLPVKIAQLDWRLAGLVAVIALVGAAMLWSVAGGSWEPWAGNHLTRFSVFFVMMMVLALVDLRWWYAMAYPVYGAGLLLLVAVELVGETRMGATRWLDLGFTSLQPSEIMKLGIVLALARWYHGASAQEARFHWKLIVPALMLALPVVLVAHQPDLGTSLLILFTGVAIMFVAGLSWKIVVAGIGSVLAIAPMMYFFVLHEYQRRRVDVLFNPEADPSGSGYHIAQAKIAIGSGGFLGKGFGLGSQSQLNFLPEKHTDFIFPTVAEEFGFIGAFLVLVVYGLIVAAALRIASVSHNHFGRLAAAGVTATFALYVLINGAMVMGLAPVVGVPMPLLSYGGTVMMTVMIGFGLVMAVKVHRYLELPKGPGLL
ncbi:rod shape-determining protein RodA [Brevundimonas sp. 2R-24]|uniref:Peptidoglycan glycosyltransferase MrdB n=1 Tax=Peiella sedimenti TaxID=3061083 RepID=A0ABT8SJI8_9CAUL|nr:rod shape-determining protein RodA [Caulobacteraceae bacterium XZ-24]